MTGDPVTCSSANNPERIDRRANNIPSDWATRIDETADREARALLPPAVVHWCDLESIGPILFPPLVEPYKQALAHFGQNPTYMEHPEYAPPLVRRAAAHALVALLCQWRDGESIKAYGPTYPLAKRKI